MTAPGLEARPELEDDGASTGTEVGTSEGGHRTLIDVLTGGSE